MPDAFLSNFCQINQQAVWLLPFLPIHQAFGTSFVHGELCDWLNTYFNNHHIPITTYDNQPLTFTQQNDLPHGNSYEHFIAKTGKIPTRNNLHDWFGACIWATFPKAKAVLNRHHLLHSRDDGKRNRIRDAITVFDENGAILVVSDDRIGTNIANALTKFDWHNALLAPRCHWHNPIAPSANDKAQVVIFGHALLEQLITPRKPLTAHSVILSVSADFFGQSLPDKLAIIDTLLSKYLYNWLSQDKTTPQDLQPLPILGVPYFWQGQDETFYGDTQVFRLGRRNQTR